MFNLRYLIPALLSLLWSCSHDYESNTLDLGFYQWNFWADPEAQWDNGQTMDTSYLTGETAVHPPSCGWDVLHRGNGKLVRIPATVGVHFSNDYTGVLWFHSRFTLPEIWAGTDITLAFEGISGKAEIYLNEKLVGNQFQSNDPFSLDLTGQIYYTRDNHLSIRITDSNPGGGGVTGKITLKSSSKAGKSPGSPAS